MFVHEPDRLAFDGAPVELEFWASFPWRGPARQICEPAPQRFAVNDDVDKVNAFGCLASFWIFIGKARWPYPVGRAVDDQGRIREEFWFDRNCPGSLAVSGEAEGFCEDLGIV